MNNYANFVISQICVDKFKNLSPSLSVPLLCSLTSQYVCISHKPLLTVRDLLLARLLLNSE